MFKTHRIFIILFCLVVYLNPYNLFNWISLPNLFSFEFLIFILIAIFASMVPDIDNPSSKLGKNVKIFGYVFKHRGFFHSLPALLLFSWIFSNFVNNTYAAAFALGYFSHLLLDNLTHQGIYWLYPFKFRVKGIVKSNGWFEKILFYVCLLLILILLLLLI
ncbi:metal-dependent hydrolase [Candidatus Woesearchaeota archaeon]|nr:metal-dependent hydrolase [Candidatus Woesearchaeota archaeon]